MKINVWKWVAVLAIAMFGPGWVLATFWAHECREAQSIAEQNAAGWKDAVATGTALAQQRDFYKAFFDGYSEGCQKWGAQAQSAPAPAPDADTVTIIADLSNMTQEAETSGASSPLFDVANLLRPGLGTALAKLDPPPNPAPVAAAPRITRWVVQGRVTPYIVTTDADQYAFVYYNLKTGDTELHQPQSARDLLSTLRAQARKVR